MGWQAVGTGCPEHVQRRAQQHQRPPVAELQPEDGLDAADLSDDSERSAEDARMQQPNEVKP